MMPCNIKIIAKIVSAPHSLMAIKAIMLYYTSTIRFYNTDSEL